MQQVAERRLQGSVPAAGTRAGLSPVPVAASQAALVAKTRPASAADLRGVGSIPGSGRSPGGGHGSPLLDPGESHGRGAWRVQSMGPHRVRHDCGGGACTCALRWRTRHPEGGRVALLWRTHRPDGRAWLSKPLEPPP